MSGREPQSGATPLTAVKVLIQGRPGSGKTRFAASFPRPRFFDFNQGFALYAAGYPGSSYHNDYRRLDSANPPTGFSQFAVGPASDLERAIADPSVETLVLETIADLGQSILAWAIHRRTVGAKGGSVEARLGKPELDDYGWAKSYSEAVLRSLLGSGKHVVVTSHEDTPETSGIPGYDGSYATVVPPLTIGKLKNELGGLFDFHFGAFQEPDPKTGQARFYIAAASQAKRDFKVRTLYPELFQGKIDVTGRSGWGELKARLDEQARRAAASAVPQGANATTKPA